MVLTNDDDPNWEDIWKLLAIGAALEAVVLFFPVAYALYTSIRAKGRGGDSVLSQNFRDNDEAYHAVQSLFTVESALDNLDRVKIAQTMNRKHAQATGTSWFEDFYVTWSIRRLLVDDFVISTFGATLEYLRLGINVMALTLFALSSFQRRIRTAVAVLNLILGSAMLADFFFKTFLLPFPSGGNIFLYLLGSSVVFEALSIPSVLLAGTGWVSYANFGFFRVIPLYQNLVKISYPAENKVESEEGLESKRIRPFVVCWSAYIASLFFSLASLVLLAEVLPTTDFWSSGEWSVLNASYFMIVTVTTVGYGDFSPVTYPGVVATMFFLVFVLFYVALKVSFLLEVYSNTKSGKGAYQRRPGARFVVVVGTPEFAHFASFLATFYSIPVLLSTQVVVLSQTNNYSKEQLAKIRRHPKYGSSVKFFVGTVLSEVDRKRVSLRDAEAVFAFATGPVESALSEDARNILRIVCIRDRWATMPLYASHVLPETFVHMERSIKSSSNTERLGDAVCQRDLWASFAALNVRCPGSSTLISNLFASWDTSLAEDDLPWLREYKLGASNSLTGLMLSDHESASAKTLGELTNELYMDRGVLLLAVADSESKTLFFPNLHPTMQLNAESIAFLVGNETKLRVMRNTPTFLPADLVSSTRYSSVVQNATRTAAVRTKSLSRKAPEELEAEDASQPEQQIVPDHELDGHTIVTGYNEFSLPDADMLVSKLSNQYYDGRNRNRVSEIVVLLPHLENDDIASFHDRNPRTRVRVGSALVLDDLLAAGLQTAKTLVVLLEIGANTQNEAFEYDSRPVFTTMLVDQVVSACRDDLTIQTFIRDSGAAGLLRAPQPRFLRTMLGVPQNRQAEGELVQVDSDLTQSIGKTTSSHAKVVDSRKMMNEEMFCRPKYAAGEIVLTSLSGSYLAKDYQMPGAMRLLKFLVNANNAEEDVLGCNVHLVGVPGSLADEPYWKAFQYLLKKDALPLGLYRSGRGPMFVPPINVDERKSFWSRRPPKPMIPVSNSTESLGAAERSEAPVGSAEVPGGLNTLPWVYTNPESHTRLLKSDGIFIMATNEAWSELLTKEFPSFSGAHMEAKERSYVGRDEPTEPIAMRFGEDRPV